MPQPHPLPLIPALIHALHRHRRQPSHHQRCPLRLLWRQIRQLLLQRCPAHLRDGMGHQHPIPKQPPPSAPHSPLSPLLSSRKSCKWRLRPSSTRALFWQSCCSSPAGGRLIRWIRRPASNGCCVLACSVMPGPCRWVDLGFCGCFNGMDDEAWMADGDGGRPYRALRAYNSGNVEDWGNLDVNGSGKTRPYVDDVVDWLMRWDGRGGECRD